MKKILFYVLSLSLVFSLCINPTSVKAVDFEGNEDYYIEKCSNYTYAQNAGKQTCNSFMSYLKNKNTQLKQNIKDTTSSIRDTEQELTQIKAQIDTLNADIAAKEEEISFLNNAIAQLEADIKERETELRDRMYTTQSQINSNSYVEFIFGSQNLSEMFSRLETLNELTNYDKELVRGLAQDKENIETQKQTVVDAQAVLAQQKKECEDLQVAYQNKLGDLNQALVDSKNAQEDTAEAQAKVNEALTYVAQSGGSTNWGQIDTSGLTGDAALGVAIANAALAKQGCLYYWGATGPNYFDCSGLVYYAHNAAGRSIGRTTARGYANSGVAISYNQLQPGDVVTFYGYGYVCHIGIYVGSGNVVHAAGAGSGTVGNRPNEYVRVTPIGSVGLPVYNYRRLY